MFGAQLFEACVVEMQAATAQGSSCDDDIRCDVQFKENEEKFEKKVQEQLSGAADAAKSTASDAVEAAKDALPQNVKGDFYTAICNQEDLS